MNIRSGSFRSPLAKWFVVVLVVGSLIGNNHAAYAADGESNESAVASQRVEWFSNARLGMFIHWSAGGVEGARWRGEPLRNPSPYGEWLRCRNRVPRADYDRLVAQMSVTKEHVDLWAQMAKNGGMKYLIFVAKHHDGLAMWPSEVSDYTYQELTGDKTDVVQLVADACQRHGLKLGFYYSQWQDWEHPFGWGNFWDYESDVTRFANVNWHDDLMSGRLFRPTLKPKQYQQYWQQKSLPQVEELIKRYDPDLFWFDMYVPLHTTNMKREDVQMMLNRIRKLSPKCLVNTRLGIAEIGAGGVDYQTMGDNQIPEGKINHPWESSVTLNRSWGYNRDDTAWKPVSHFVRSLVKNISNGGNLQINIGPRADGTVPRETAVALREIGNCLSSNQGKGFYRCGSSPFRPTSQDWGLVTTSLNDQRKIYLHVFEWPHDGVIRLNGLKTKIASAKIACSDESLDVSQLGLSARILGNSSSPPVAYDTVIVLDLADSLIVEDDFIGEKNMGGYYLSAAAADRTDARLMPSAQKGWIPPHVSNWKMGSSVLKWRVYIPEKSTKQVSICYACTTSQAGDSFEVLVDGKVRLAANTKATHVNWNEYRTFELGELPFEQPGCYDIEIRRSSKQSNELMHFAWMHLD